MWRNTEREQLKNIKVNQFAFWLSTLALESKVLFSVMKHFTSYFEVWTCTMLLIILIITVVLMSLEVSLAQRASAQRKCGWSTNRLGHVVRVEGQLPPHLQFPRTVAHRKSESTHISQCAHTHIKMCTARKKIPGCSSGYDPITVPLHRPCSQHSDDLLLELVNTGHPEWEGACTSLEAVFHQQTVRSFDLTYQTWNLQ